MTTGLSFQVGSFFGAHDGTLMKELILSDELDPLGRPRGVFKKSVHMKMF